MPEVLTHAAATLPTSSTEVLTPPLVSAPPTTAAGAPADGATTPNPASPEKQAGSDGLTVGGKLDSAESLDQFAYALQTGALKITEVADKPAGDVPAVPVGEQVVADSTAPAPVVEQPGQSVPAVEDLDEGLPAPGQLPRALKLKTHGDALRFETMKIVKARDEAGVSVTFTEAESIARQALGLPAIETAAAVPGASEVPASGQVSDGNEVAEMPATVDEAIARIKELNKQQGYLSANFRWDEATDVANQIVDLNAHLNKLSSQKNQAEQIKVSYDDQWIQASSAAVTEFASHGAGDSDSALSLIATAIQNDWVSRNDPRLANPADAPRLIYQAALAKINPTAANAAPVATAAPVQPVPAATPAPIVQPPFQRALTPAMALLSSSSGAAVPHGPVKLDLSKITNSNDLDSLAAALDLKLS